jgi:hypothetical protein
MELVSYVIFDLRSLSQNRNKDVKQGLDYTLLNFPCARLFEDVNIN